METAINWTRLTELEAKAKQKEINREEWMELESLYSQLDEMEDQKQKEQTERFLKDFQVFAQNYVHLLAS